MIFSDLDQINQALPPKGRLLALDLGSKRIGLAISDESRFIATPKLILNRLGNQKDFGKIKKFISENQIVAIVIGMPIDMNENQIAMSDFAKKFAENFDEFLEKKLPIFFFEERLTSFLAREIDISRLSRKKNSRFVDDIAASFILQHFLDFIQSCFQSNN